jgi:uncharacterized membrane protein YbjE (DUF340 family)
LITRRKSDKRGEGIAMSTAVIIRRTLFVCGVVSVLLSVSLVVGSFIRHVDTNDYLKQADEGVPWVRWGLGSSLLGFVFGFFGNKWWRVATVITALLLLVLWYLIGESLY